MAPNIPLIDPKSPSQSAAACDFGSILSRLLVATDGWKDAVAEMGAHLSSPDLATRDARLAAAVQLMGGDVAEKKMVTVQPGSVVNVHKRCRYASGCYR